MTNEKNLDKSKPKKGKNLKCFHFLEPCEIPVIFQDLHSWIFYGKFDDFQSLPGIEKKVESLEERKEKVFFYGNQFSISRLFLG